jgi:hypothetical protein
MQVFRTIFSGLTRGLLLFLPWAAFRYFWLWQMPFDRTTAKARLTDVELSSLELVPGSDLHLLLGLVGLAGGVSLLFLLRPGHRRKSAVWALAASSFLLGAFSTIFFPVLVMSNRLPSPSFIPESIEQIAWIYVIGLILAWIFMVSILWAAVMKERPKPWGTSPGSPTT